MSYLNQRIIATGKVDGINVTIEEGLNFPEDWELRLEVPKTHPLFERFDNGEYIYDKVTEGDVVNKTVHEFYFAEDPVTGQCSFYVQTDNTNGFGGAKYRLQMRDGSVEELHGPWSSRCGVMNRMGFPPSMEVTVKSRYNMASAMSIPAIIKLIEPLGYTIDTAFTTYDVCYKIVKKGDAQ